MNQPLHSNWQSVVWVAAGENRPKQPKMQTSAGKVLTSVFWDVQFFFSLITLGKEEPSIASII